MAIGAASLMVRTGSRTSESTELMLAYPMKDLEREREKEGKVISKKYTPQRIDDFITIV